jgi:hypothetical protein
VGAAPIGCAPAVRRAGRFHPPLHTPSPHEYFKCVRCSRPLPSQLPGALCNTKGRMIFRKPPPLDTTTSRNRATLASINPSGRAAAPREAVGVDAPACGPLSRRVPGERRYTSLRQCHPEPAQAGTGQFPAQRVQPGGGGVRKGVRQRLRPGPYSPKGSQAAKESACASAPTAQRAARRPRSRLVHPPPTAIRGPPR